MLGYPPPPPDAFGNKDNLAGSALSMVTMGGRQGRGLDPSVVSGNDVSFRLGRKTLQKCRIWFFRYLGMLNK